MSPVKLAPPFLKDSIRLTVPVTDCAQFNFNLEFVGGGRAVASLNTLQMPALADQPGFVPPPVTSVLSLSYNTAGKPIYGVKTSSGVSAACLPAYFEAYDAYSQEPPVNYYSIQLAAISITRGEGGYKKGPSAPSNGLFNFTSCQKCF